jgi:predicted methyltransferase
MILSGGTDTKYINNDCIDTIRSDMLDKEKGLKGAIIRLRNGEVISMTIDKKEYQKMISKLSGEEVIFCDFIH